ncbi:MAG: 5-formyltetrahydrofolate cyclo-ligase [Nitrospirae bacterium]|nr:5-formyltetrahydrofolate cyclo-ligase [Nitrospirota bacterium]
MDTAEQKRALRRRMGAARDGLDTATCAAHGLAAAERVAALDAYRTAETVLVTLAIGRELPTAPVVARILADGKRLVLPRVAGTELSLHQVADPATQLAPGCWDILEPVPGLKPLHPNAVDLFLLPGLAFDARGGRLGYGRGFFDRVLARSEGVRAGLGYDMQVVETVPVAEWDARLDWIITPTRVIHCRGRERNLI